MRHRKLQWILAAISCVAPGLPAAGEDAAEKALRQHQLRRQQQQEQLQLRMQQQQRGAQDPPSDARRRQAIEQLEAHQRRRQEGEQYRQEIAPETAHPSDDAGTRRAKAEMERERAREQGERQLRRFDSELQRQIEKK